MAKKKAAAKKAPTAKKDNRLLVEELAAKTSKSAVLRMANLFPEHLTRQQKKVLKGINTERSIYMGSCKKIDLETEVMTPVLNLGQFTIPARNRVHDKMVGTRAYSLLDLAAIQLLELIHSSGIDITKIKYDSDLTTSLPAKSKSKSDLGAAVRGGKKLSAADKQGLEQFKLQHAFYEKHMESTGLDIWGLSYLVSLGSETRSTYNRTRDKLRGQRPYSILDLVMARSLSFAVENGIDLTQISYDEDGRRVKPKALKPYVVK